MPSFPRTSPELQREYCVGVPIPGAIVPPNRRVKTRIRNMPVGRLTWETPYGRGGPEILEIGCGAGRFTISSAVSRPECRHLGVNDQWISCETADHRGLANVRFAQIGGRALLETHIAAGSVLEIHCYHPRPCYRARHVQTRLVTPHFLALTHRALATQGLLVLQTDSVPYWNYIRQVVPLFFDFEEHPYKWPDAPLGRSIREQFSLRAGLPVFRGIGRAKKGPIDSQLLETADQIPPPSPNFDQKLFDLDAFASAVHW